MLLEIDGVTKSYRKSASAANDGIDLRVEAGEIYGLLGHNGAGKTTLVNQIVGLIRPDSGTIAISGRDVIANPAFARRACSIQPQAQVPINGLTPRQAIETIGRIRGGDAALVRARTDRLIAALDLDEWRNTDGARLSGGVKRLVSFCMAAVVPGKLVILDEPTNDVDPVRRRLLWAEVRALGADGAAVLLVTHNVVEAERSVDRLAILDHGRVLTSGTPADLKAGIADELRLELVLEPGSTPPEIPSFGVAAGDGSHTGAAAHASPTGSAAGTGGGVADAAGAHRLVATVPDRFAAEAAAWAQGLRRAGRIEEFSLTPATLEDAYVALVGAAQTADANRMEDTDVRAA